MPPGIMKSSARMQARTCMKTLAPLFLPEVRGSLSLFFVSIDLEVQRNVSLP